MGKKMNMSRTSLLMAEVGALLIVLTMDGLNVLNESAASKSYHLSISMISISLCGLIAIGFYKKNIILKKSMRRLVAENSSQLEMVKTNMKFAMIGKEIACINHDINNLLCVLDGSMTKLKRIVPEGNDLLNKQFDRVERTISRFHSLTSALRSVALGSNESLATNEVSLRNIVMDCKVILDDRLQKSGIELICEIDENIKIMAEKDVLYQAVINLVSNSIDAISGTDSPWIKIDYAAHNGRDEVLIIDSGNGIPKQHISKLFQPLFTTKSNGTGLGLIHVKKMLNTIGGDLNYNEKNPNTCFVMYFSRTDSFLKQLAA